MTRTQNPIRYACKTRHPTHPINTNMIIKKKCRRQRHVYLNRVGSYYNRHPKEGTMLHLPAWAEYSARNSLLNLHTETNLQPTGVIIKSHALMVRLGVDMSDPAP